MKPHLKRMRGYPHPIFGGLRRRCVPLWSCTYRGEISCGRTPLEAYTRAVYQVTEGA